jgi:hypothetical protein
MRLLAAGMLIAAEMAVVTVFLVVGLVPAGAQRFEDLFPFFGRNNRSARPGRSLAPDFSMAPAPKKAMRSRSSRPCCSARRRLAKMKAHVGYYR